jgi:hypothetical protein
MGGLENSLRDIFTRCLRTGTSPPQWKESALVFLPKEGKLSGRLLSYQPICLLDETGKLFERIIARRLVQHLSREESLD